MPVSSSGGPKPIVVSRAVSSDSRLVRFSKFVGSFRPSVPSVSLLRRKG